MQFKSDCHKENMLMESCGCVVTFSPFVLPRPLLPTSLFCFRYPWLHPPALLWKTYGRSSQALLLPATGDTDEQCLHETLPFKLFQTDMTFTHKSKVGEKWQTNLNVGGVELLLHHLLQNGERWLDGIFQCHGLSEMDKEKNPNC